MKPASIGSISSGTHRTQDLLESFADYLEGLILINGDYLSTNHGERDRFNNLHGDALDCWNEDGDDIEEGKRIKAACLVDSLYEVLNEFSPPYCYFGSRPGDGADFGFWPFMDDIEELPRVESSDEAIELGEDCLYVNDHGNCTVFNGEGVAILEVV